MRAIVMYVFLTVSFVLALPAHGQGNPGRAAEEIDADLLVQMRNQTLENFIAKLLAPIRNARQPDRLTLQDVEAAERAAKAASRATMMTQMLALDLDGDGVVALQEAEVETPAAIRAGARGQWRAERRNRNVERFMAADTDSDERIDLVEMFAWADAQPAPRGEGRTALQRLVLELDTDGDGATTVREAEARARQLFARYDLDGDGIVDVDRQDEINAVERARKSELDQQRRAEACGMPPAPADAKIVHFTSASAQAVSATAINGPLEATYTAAVTIEPGNEKIYLVLSADVDMVWRVDGAVERLSSIVLLESTGDPRRTVAAATGVDPSLVLWAERDQCSSVRGTSSRQRTAQLFTALHGRPADILKQVNAVASIAVPSMELVGEARRSNVPVKRTACRVALGRGMVFSPEPVEGADAEPCDWIRAEMEIDFPGGVIDIEPASVVARQRAVRYDVLPSPFGYRAALDAGILVDISQPRDVRYRLSKPLEYFPPGLRRGQQISFELAEGIELPQGRTNRICAFDAEGKQLPTENAARCRR